jgi:hypothetical protein
MPSFSEIGGLCQSCHDPGSVEATSGLELQEVVLRAEAAGTRAREAIRVLVQGGERVEDEEIRLQEVETNLRELMVLAHTLDPIRVEDVSIGVVSWAEGITQRAESVQEHRWERRLLAIPVWILLMGGVLLALRKRRRLTETGVENGRRLGEGVEL